MGSSRQGLWILFAAVGMVLLIGCANVACLLLTQSHRRAREMAIRISLGARRGQIVRQLLGEAFLIALPGSLCGLLLAVWGTEFLRSVVADRLPRAEGIALNWQVAGFTLLLGVLTTIVFGLLPALTPSRAETGAALAHGSRTQVGGSQNLLRMLVGAQVALAMVLLVGAGLLIRSMVSLLHVPLGFDTHNVLTLHVSASWAEKNNMLGVQHRLQRTLAAIESAPGVSSAAVALNLPGAGGDYNLELHMGGRQSRGTGEKVLANAPVVSASYFRTLGIPLLAGQMCRDVIDSKEPQQAMVNRQFVDRFLPNENPVGHTLEAGEGSKTSSTLIVGVVGDTRDTSRMEAPTPTVYWCTLPGFWPDPIYLVKTQAARMALATDLRALLKRLEPGRAVYGLAPLEDQLATNMDERRLETVLLSSFGLTALLLASVGLYGVVGFYVSQRTREIGLRIALGARPGQVFRQVFRQGALLCAGGVAAGIAAGALLTRSVSSLLFGVGRWDPVTFVAGPAILLAVGALATWMPARRATQVEPMEALRDQ
ncbi:MAG TPA: FtsX-like permease family protein [Bryobacteraceae bacterium]|nr:FtsX-like permease family protein [Bryobacteraceae bacterium]